MLSTERCRLRRASSSTRLCSSCRGGQAQFAFAAGVEPVLTEAHHLCITGDGPAFAIMDLDQITQALDQPGAVFLAVFGHRLRDEAQNRKEDPHSWHEGHNGGQAMVEAMRFIEKALWQINPKEEFDIAIERQIDLIKQQRALYRRLDNDPYQYGNHAFSEMIKDLQGLKCSPVPEHH